MTREICLDTETTGLKFQAGHRVIEIGCVEMINRELTGNHFHFYVRPDPYFPVDPGAFAIHGISDESLADKPTFNELAHDFMNYIEGAELIIHNAPFDVGFLDNEIRLYNKSSKKSHPPLKKLCTITDTLTMARKRYPGQKNNLDALCKRLGVDNTHRELHGALLDAEILAQVYLAMTSGQGGLFESVNTVHNPKTTPHAPNTPSNQQQWPKTLVQFASESELEAHERYLADLKK